MGLLPKHPRDLQRLKIQLFPPIYFIAGLMQLPMIPTAKGHGELITDLHADGSGLGKAQMMRIGWLSPANETGLRGNQIKVCLVANALGLGDGELAFVDAPRS